MIKLAQKASIDDCMSMYKRLSSRIFKRNCLTRIPGLGNIFRLLTGAYSDSLYCPQRAEQALKEAYGHDTMMFSNSSLNGIKIAVTGTDEKAETELFTNHHEFNNSPENVVTPVVHHNFSMWLA